jgi:hypothetical protein
MTEQHKGPVSRPLCRFELDSCLSDGIGRSGFPPIYTRLTNFLPTVDPSQPGTRFRSAPSEFFAPWLPMPHWGGTRLRDDLSIPTLNGNATPSAKFFSKSAESAIS